MSFRWKPVVLSSDPILLVALYAGALWLTTACSSCSDARHDVAPDGGGPDGSVDAGADAGEGADAGSDAGGDDDGGTFVSPGPFALEWVACLGDPGFAYQSANTGLAVLRSGRVAAAGQVNTPSGSSFLTVLEADGSIAWSASYTSIGAPDASQAISMGVAEAESGDLVVTGMILGAVILDDGGGSTLQLEAADGWDWFLARYSEDGALLWAFPDGSVADSMNSGIEIVAAPNDTVIVTGRITEPVVFGPGEANETTLPSAGAFIARYDATGELLWAKGTIGEQALGEGLALFEDGEVVQVGGVDCGIGDGTITFGPGEANEKQLTPEGGGDIFVARYAIEDGALRWAVLSGSSESAYEHGRDAAPAGSNAVLVGVSEGVAEFGDLTLGPDATAYIAAGLADGSFSWAKRIGWSGGDEAFGVAADTDGLYAVGYVGGPTAVFGYGEENETSFSLPTADRQYGFVARYQFNGALDWAGIIPSAETNCAIEPHDIASASEDEFVVSGSYGNGVSVEVATFGYDSDGNPLTCDGANTHPFVAKYRVQ